MVYEVLHPVSVALVGILCALLIGGLSALLARWLVDPDVGTDALMGAIIMPAIMAFAFVLAGARRHFRAGESRWAAAWGAARRNAVAGLAVGFVFVVFTHFLGQLLITRALYGSLEFHKHILDYIGLIPVLYGLLFAVPIALGCALYAAYITISGDLIYTLATRLPVGEEA